MKTGAHRVWIWALGAFFLVACDRAGNDTTPGNNTDRITRTDKNANPETRNVEINVSYDEEKSDLRKKVEARINDLDKEIDQMKESSKNASDDMKAKWNEAIADLERSREKSKSKLNEIKQSTKDNWNVVKEEARVVLDDLEQASKKAKDAVSSNN